MIGLLGAHRTGKTTLCQAVLSAAHGNIREKQISISNMQKRLGFDSSKQDHDWETRKLIQLGLLEAFKVRITESVFKVADMCETMSERTPLDLIGYLVVNAPDNLTKEDIDWINEYTAYCIELTNAHYTDVFLVQPGITYVDCTTSAKEDSMDALNAIYLKTLLDPRLTVNRHIITHDMLDIEDRVRFVLENANV